MKGLGGGGWWAIQLIDLNILEVYCQSIILSHHYYPEGPLLADITVKKSRICLLTQYKSDIFCKIYHTHRYIYIDVFQESVHILFCVYCVNRNEDLKACIFINFT